MQRKVALGSEQIGMLEKKRGYLTKDSMLLFVVKIRLDEGEGENYGKMVLGSRSTQRARIGVWIGNFSFAIANRY